MSEGVSECVSEQWAQSSTAFEAAGSKAYGPGLASNPGAAEPLEDDGPAQGVQGGLLVRQSCGDIGPPRVSPSSRWPLSSENPQQDSVTLRADGDPDHRPH